MTIHVSLTKKRKREDKKHTCDGDGARYAPAAVHFSPFIGCVSAKEPDGQSASCFSLQRLFHLALPLKQFSK